VPSKQEGRTDWSSLFVFGAALLLLAASVLPASAYRWGALVLLVFAGAKVRLAPPANALAALLVVYCGWLFANAAFFSVAYSADGIYRPAILLAAATACAALARESLARLFRFGAALLALLVLLGLLQYYFGFWHFAHNPERAAATFVTPNTFATAINLILLPLVAIQVLGKGGRRVVALALWLFAGLIASGSRGGLLAFFGGLAMISLCLDRRAAWRARPTWLPLVAGWLIVALVVPLLRHISFGGGAPGIADTDLGVVYARGTWDRVEIYMTTMGLILQHPFAGAGANMFFPLFEANKPYVFRNYVFPFAHNDYLQVWLEYGIVGLGLLLALVGTALVLARRASLRMPGDPLPIACAGALAGCFAHSMVDFPLYVPFTLMVTGSYLGAIASRTGSSARLGIAFPALWEKAATPLIKAALASFALAWLAQPVIADLAADHAIRELFAGRVDNGLYWASVARRLEPRKSAHYWAEGTIWRDQAIATGNKMLAARADAMFREGVRAEPYQVANYLELAKLHRTHPGLFDRPVTPQQVLEWAAKAAKLRPYSVAAQAEYARSLAAAGRLTEAKQVAAKILKDHPESPLAQNVAAELQ